MEPGSGTVARPPTRPDLPEPRWWEGGSWRSAATVSLFGLIADLLVRPPLGLGSAACLAIGAIVFIAVARPGTISIIYLSAAVMVGGFLAIRSNPTLLFLEVGAATILVVLGPGATAAGSSMILGVRSHAHRTAGVLLAVPRGCAMAVGPPTRAIMGSPGRVRVIPRLTMIVLPVVAAFVVLLSSADAVFAHYLSVPIGAFHSLASLPRHAVAIGAGTLILATLISGAPTSPGEAPAPIRLRERLRRADWIFLLGAVDTLFAAFVAVQASYLFGGQSRVLAQQGLTFAEYARSGFAQLIVAVLLTAALIAAAWFVGAKEGTSHDRTFAILAGTLVMLSLVVLASAFRRLVAYGGAFGWTWPRLEVHLTIVFLAVLLMCSLIAITLRRAWWLPTAAVGTAVVMLIGLNVMDPDRFIAERNIARYRATGSLDIDELAHISPDATAPILDSMATFNPADRTVLMAALGCQAASLGSDQGSIASWNLGRAAAAGRLQVAGVDGCR